MNTFYRRSVKFLRALSKPLVTLHVSGEENLPKNHEGYIFAVKHVSPADPVLLGIAMVDEVQIHALAKNSLFTIPVIGKALSRMEHISVDRGSREASQALLTASEYLKQGEVVGIYPEGTVPRTEGLGDFKSGLARLALETGATIIPVGQYGMKRKISAGAFFKKLFQRNFQHYIAIGEPILVQETVSATREQVVALTEQARDAIGALSLEAETLFLKASPKAIPA